ncbi:hypothetical protein SLE2022_025340 [Rubroshorea leprosula]
MAIAVAFLPLLLLLASPTAYEVNYVAGDTSGWSQGVDYSTWKNIQCGRHTFVYLRREHAWGGRSDPKRL